MLAIELFNDLPETDTQIEMFYENIVFEIINDYYIDKGKPKRIIEGLKLLIDRFEDDNDLKNYMNDGKITI